MSSEAKWTSPWPIEIEQWGMIYRRPVKLKYGHVTSIPPMTPGKVKLNPRVTAVLAQRFAPTALILAFCLWPNQALCSEFEFGSGLTSFRYDESLPSPSKSSENGIFSSFKFGYSQTLRNQTDAPGIEALNVQGELSPDSALNFDGTAVNTSNGSISPAITTNRHIFAKVESNLVIRLNNKFDAVLGAGYRYWNRYLAYGSSYREIYTWNYINLGLSLAVYESELWQFKPQLTLRPAFRGKMAVIFSETIYNGNDSVLDLGPRLGYRLDFPMRYQIASNWLINGRLWYERSEIGESPTVYNTTPKSGGGVLGNIYEPASLTTQIGLDISISKMF
jgi:hypothetical protein